MHNSKIKILVVEDENSIRRFITLNLEAAGYESQRRQRGRSHCQARRFSPAVVVLDLMLPGWTVLRSAGGFAIPLRNAGCHADRQGQDTDKILGLELGAR